MNESMIGNIGLLRHTFMEVHNLKTAYTVCSKFSLRSFFLCHLNVVCLFPSQNAAADDETVESSGQSLDELMAQMKQL